MTSRRIVRVPESLNAGAEAAEILLARGLPVCTVFVESDMRALGLIERLRQAGVPVVPFAAAGVDDTFDVNGAVEGSGRFLMGHDKYDLPRLAGGVRRHERLCPVPPR